MRRLLYEDQRVWFVEAEMQAAHGALDMLATAEVLDGPRSSGWSAAGARVQRDIGFVNPTRAINRAMRLTRPIGSAVP